MAREVSMAKKKYVHWRLYFSGQQRAGFRRTWPEQAILNHKTFLLSEGTH